MGLPPRGRRVRGHVLGLGLLMPWLLFVSALGGRTFWLHAHGPEGLHVHQATDELAPELAWGLGSRHQADHHAHDSGDLPDDEKADREAPSTIAVVQIPIVDLASGRLAAQRLSIDPIGPVPSLAAYQDAARPRPPDVRPDRGRDRGAPRRPSRSGIAAVLGSSHAILL